MRSGEEKVFDMTLRGKEGTIVAKVETRSEGMTALGAELRAVTSDEMKALAIQNGVKVTSINGGKFRSSGIREGFIITRIDQEAVNRPEDVERILANKKGGVLIEGVYANGTKAYYGLGL